MKEFYQIHELAKLFDLCPDTLRYYEEKGLLHPVRGENRYRMYGIQDVCSGERTATGCTVSRMCVL